MKKKQLFAVLLAGSMTVGMAPAAAFAAEDTGAAAEAEAQLTDENTDTADTTGTAEETETSDNTAEAEADKETEASDSTAETEADKEAEESAAAEAEAQKQAEEQAAAEAEAQKQAEEQAAEEAAEKGTIVTTEAELKDAIKAAADVDTATVTEAEPVKIVISGTIELEKSVTIPENKSIAILGADTQASIERADSFKKGNLFEVSANSALYMAKKDATETDTTAGTLTVDGSVTDGSAVEGSLVHVATGANFFLTTGVSLVNNNTTAKGAAIFNEGGSVLITGGTITGNKCDYGAVYSTGTISVKKGEGAADTEPGITGNTKADGTTPANILLSGEGKIEVKGEITDKARIGFSLETPVEGQAVITKADDLADDVFATALENLYSQYEGDETFEIDKKTGKLAGVTTTVTPTPTTTTTVTPTPTTTVTPKPTKKPTSTPTPAAKVDIKWTGFEWTSHDSASVTLRSSVSGTCYYTWVERGDDGTSSTPDKSAIKNKQSVSKDKKFTIYLNDLDTDKAVDLYIYVKSSEGTASGIKRIKLDQAKRPAKSDDNHTPVVPNVTDSVVKGLDSALAFYPNTFYPFEVIGAGTTNSNPGEGDVKWEPLYWSTSENPSDKAKHSTWKIGSTKGISKAETYSLYVFFQKWVYTNGEWTETDTISSARYQFSSLELTATPTTEGGTTGGQTGSDSDATVTGEASATSSNGGNGTTSKNAVSTADNSPIGTMSALALASVLAGGYVIVRRRKKDI